MFGVERKCSRFLFNKQLKKSIHSRLLSNFMFTLFRRHFYNCVCLYMHVRPIILFLRRLKFIFSLYYPCFLFLFIRIISSLSPKINKLNDCFIISSPLKNILRSNRSSRWRFPGVMQLSEDRVRLV